MSESQPSSRPRRSPAQILRGEVLDAYGIDPETSRLEELRAGHINDSFRVRDPAEDLIFQRINSHVFRDPEALMSNFVVVSDHLRARLIEQGDPEVDRHCLSLRETTNGDAFFVDRDGELWRATRFLERTVTHSIAGDAALTRAAGLAYGRFQSLLSDLDSALLTETIPRFHDTPHRFSNLDRAVDRDLAGRRARVGAVIEQAQSHRKLASRLFDLSHEHAIPTRIAHNDAKLTNVLFDQGSSEPIVVLDLDTVMPGLSLYDFGDMARSMSHRTAEDEQDPSTVRVDPELFSALAGGYLQTAQHLSQAERTSLVDAALVLVLEQAVRYLTDYLDGDLYFRTRRESQNLHRAQAHLALLASMQEQENELREAVEA